MIASELTAFQVKLRMWSKTFFEPISFAFIENHIIFSRTVLKAISIFHKE